MSLTSFERELLREALSGEIDVTAYCPTCTAAGVDAECVVTNMHQDADQLIAAVERAGFEFRRVRHG